MYTILDCQNVPTSGFVVLSTYIFDDVPTSGLAKCTYFWILKMYILLDFHNVPTSGLQYVPTYDVHNSVFFKMYLLLMYPIMSPRIILLEANKCTQPLALLLPKFQVKCWL